MAASVRREAAASLGPQHARIGESAVMAEQKLPKPRVDGQMTGLAGEYFVAAELRKRSLQTSLTLGKAKAIDRIAMNPDRRLLELARGREPAHVT